MQSIQRKKSNKERHKTNPYANLIQRQYNTPIYELLSIRILIHYNKMGKAIEDERSAEAPTFKCQDNNHNDTEFMQCAK